MKTIVRYIINLLRAFFGVLCFLFPVKKNKICFLSFSGRGYCGDPKYICEELDWDAFTLVWGIKDKASAKTVPNCVKPCSIYSFSWIFHLMTAGVWISNCRDSFYFKRKSTLYINTWHGGGMQKKCEADAPFLSKGYIKAAKRDSKHIDLFLSDSIKQTELFKKSFWYNGYVFKSGSPRNQKLLVLDKYSKDIQSIKNSLGIDSEAFVVTYCPTFRDSMSVELFNLDFLKIKTILESFYNKKVYVLLRLHPNLVRCHVSFECDAIDVSDYQDSQDILMITDLLISDYSSIIYDYSLTNKFAIRYIPDLDDYSHERGLYYPLDSYPWPIAFSADEIINLVKNIPYDSYLNRLQEFRKTIGDYGILSPLTSVKSVVNSYCFSKVSKKELFELFKNSLA